MEFISFQCTVEVGQMNHMLEMPVSLLWDSASGELKSTLAG